jgi:predicted Rossmann fold flavoprotein
MKEYDVIVIGGGAAGMMAAGRAAERGKRVLILEKNAQLGVKLLITGGGRCNITNAEPDIRALLRHFGAAEQFLYTSFTKFGVAETFSFFESRGLPLMVEARQRAFPKSERAEDVVRVLRAYLQKGRVDVELHTPVIKIRTDKGKVSGVETHHGIRTAKHYILATGGVSHQETGSTGEGFEWLRAIGHTVHTPTPTIVPLRIKEKWVKELAGKTFSKVTISVIARGKKIHSIKGDVLCAHFGVSGPTILNLSSKVADALHGGDVLLRLDLFPGQEIGHLDARFVAILQGHTNKYVSNALKDILPAGMTEGILSACGVDPLVKVHDLTKEMRRKIVDTCKALPLTVTGLMGLDRAVIADGGVPLTEIDMQTFRSKKLPNLSIVGDVLHINRPSGGYSLQLCWTSGWIAGDTL